MPIPVTGTGASATPAGRAPGAPGGPAAPSAAEAPAGRRRFFVALGAFALLTLILFRYRLAGQDWWLTPAHPWPWWGLLAAWCLAAAATLWSYRLGLTGLRRRLRVALLLLRLGALALLVLVLTEPVLRRLWRESRPPLVAVVVDDSLSLTVPDAPGKRTRLEQAREILGRAEAAGDEKPAGLLGALAAQYRVRLFRGGAELAPLDDSQKLRATAERTDLAGVLGTLGARQGDEAGLVAVFLLTDGADNAGGDLERAVAPFRSGGVTLFPIGLGEEHAPDVELSGVRVEREVHKDTLVRLDVALRGDGFAGRQVPVVLRAGEEELARRVVTFPAAPAATGPAGAPAAAEAPQAAARFEFVPRREGYQEYAVEVPRQPGEVLAENNVRRFAVTAARRPLRVLYVEGSEYRREYSAFGYWEHEYLVKALEEDPEIRVTPLLRKDARAARAAGIYWLGHPEKGWPRTRAELFQYDVIVLSDVDIEYFRPQQLADLVEFVGKHGGGFVMVGGWTSFGAGGYDESVVDRMLPVDMLGRREGYKEYEELPGAGFTWEVTEAGFRHPLMQLDPDPARNRAIWAAMPEFYGYNRVQRAKPAAQVLAVHSDDENLYGKQVILAVQPYGHGRSLAFTTDTTAGWGVRFEEEWGTEADPNLHFRRFWQNAVRWLAEYRLQAPARLVTIRLDRALFARGERTPLVVRVLDQEYRETDAARVRLSVRAPSGKERALELAPDLRRPGSYASELVFDEVGRWELKAAATLGEQTLGDDQVAFWVDPPTAEFRDFGLHRELLSRLAALTNGRSVAAADWPRAVAELREATFLAAREEWRDAWESPWLFLVVAGLLAAEWFLRKRAGLP